jgi:hypothetical protein
MESLISQQWDGQSLIIERPLSRPGRESCRGTIITLWTCKPPLKPDMDQFAAAAARVANAQGRAKIEIRSFFFETRHSPPSRQTKASHASTPRVFRVDNATFVFTPKILRARESPGKVADSPYHSRWISPAFRWLHTNREPACYSMPLKFLQLLIRIDS